MLNCIHLKVVTDPTDVGIIAPAMCEEVRMCIQAGNKQISYKLTVTPILIENQ